MAGFFRGKAGMELPPEHSNLSGHMIPGSGGEASNRTKKREQDKKEHLGSDNAER